MSSALYERWARVRDYVRTLERKDRDAERLLTHAERAAMHRDFGMPIYEIRAETRTGSIVMGDDDEWTHPQLDSHA
jgi:hypothetical protein